MQDLKSALNKQTKPEKDRAQSALSPNINMLQLSNITMFKF